MDLSDVLGFFSIGRMSVSRQKKNQTNKQLDLIFTIIIPKTWEPPTLALTFSCQVSFYELAVRWVFLHLSDYQAYNNDEYV